MQDKHFYCVKCHGEKTVVGQSPYMFKNGANALKGTCPSCQSPIFKIVSKEWIDKRIQAAKQNKTVQSVGLIATVAFSIGVVIGIGLAVLI